MTILYRTGHPLLCTMSAGIWVAFCKLVNCMVYACMNDFFLKILVPNYNAFSMCNIWALLIVLVCGI